jgi:hypothetical protein
MADRSRKGKVLGGLAVFIGTIASAVVIWQFIKPKVLPVQLKIEYGSNVVKVVDAETGNAVSGARIYVEPRNGRGPLVDASGNPVFWTTNSDGLASPMIFPNWPPVQGPNGLNHEFDFVADKPGCKMARRFAWIPAGTGVPGQQLPFVGSPSN